MAKVEYQKTNTFSLFGFDIFKIKTIYFEKSKDNEDEEFPIIVSNDYKKEEFDIKKD